MNVFFVYFMIAFVSLSVNHKPLGCRDALTREPFISDVPVIFR